MATVKFSTPTKIDGTAGWDDAVAASGFNALANDAGFAGAEFDNSTTRYRYARFSFAMATDTVSPSEGAYLAVLIVPILSDGTNYPAFEDSSTAANQPPDAYLRGQIAFRAKASSSISGGCEDIPLPPSKFKVYVKNRRMNGTSALPASSTNMTLKVQFYNDEIG